MGKGDAIHSSIQMEYLQAIVDEKSIKAGGKQHVITNNDYVMPLSKRMVWLTSLLNPEPMNNGILYPTLS